MSRGPVSKNREGILGVWLGIEQQLAGRVLNMVLNYDDIR
jgi:hypothetical protein